MATTIHHNPVLLQQQPAEDEDIALANYLSNSLRFDQRQSHSNNNNNNNNNNTSHYYYQQQVSSSQRQRPRARVSSGTGSVVSSTSSSSNPLQVQKSTSTPIINNNNSSTRSRKQQMSRPSQLPPQQQQQNIPSSSSSNSNNRRRHSVMTLDTTKERRPSVTGSMTSTTSHMSMQSDMSMNTKLSLSKRLRKVFSMNNLRSSSDNNSLRSLSERNGSNSSVSSIATDSSPLSRSNNERSNPMSFRRRSIASLSSLFNKGPPNSSNNNDSDSIKSASTTTTITTPSSSKGKKPMKDRRHSSGDLRSLIKEDKKRPELRVDTTEVPAPVRKGGLKVRSSSSNTSNTAPDSPNSVISSRSSFSRLPPPAQQQSRALHLPTDTGLPSPTPSTSSSSKIHNDDTNIRPVGLHFNGLGLHGSPKLRPASSSTSSLIMETPRKIQFCATIQVHETFAPGDYDRRCDTNATCQKLTPMMAMKIKQELNEYKLTDMEVHVESRQYTHFFL